MEWREAPRGMPAPAIRRRPPPRGAWGPIRTGRSRRGCGRTPGPGPGPGPCLCVCGCVRAAGPGCSRGAPPCTPRPPAASMHRHRPCQKLALGLARIGIAAGLALGVSYRVDYAVRCPSRRVALAQVCDAPTPAPGPVPIPGAAGPRPQRDDNVGGGVKPHHPIIRSRQ
jgi:hypothetical protein